MSAADVQRLVDKAQAIARGDAPAGVLAAAKAHRHAAHLLHVSTREGRADAETNHVLAAVNLALSVQAWA
jgi:hypothetical protein